MTNDKPLLYFNFMNDKGTPTVFTNPITVIQTNKLNEIDSCLHNVQIAVNKGYYAAGYLAYEAAGAFYPHIQFQQTDDIPLLWFGIFERPIKMDMSNRIDHTYHATTWKPNISIQEYNDTFDRVHTYIKEGETEQVNYTIQMEADFSGDSFAFYKQLEQSQAANYSAYINIDHRSILSASPELFFHMKDGIITTKPMKGTVERGKTYEEDRQNAQWLKNSQKNRHENELIIQLMKSELGKIAQPNTITVPNKFAIEQYPTVYQMTSTVTAKIKEGIELVKLFQALFPCGSITGQPKERTMEIISQYEQNPRGIYCGAIGYMTPDHEAIFNVPIRTVAINHKTGKAVYGVGGAITIDSTKEEEYAEVITKAKVLTEKRTPFQLLETIGLHHGKFVVLDHHINRMKQSATYFNYPFNETKLRRSLRAIAQNNKENMYRVRVLLHHSGHYSIETKKYTQTKTPAIVSLAKQPIDRNNRFLYHKTTNRTLYEQHRENTDHLFDVLLWNEEEEITEFTTGNIVIEMNGKFITPPVTCGLLPGTFRKSLLEKGKITEQTILKKDLLHCDRVWFINSVRKWVPVKLV